MPATAVKRFDNTAHVEFLGYEICSNTTTTWAAIPPKIKKRVSHQYVKGDKQVLTFHVNIDNYNEFPVKLPFYDPIEVGGKFVADSFKVNGTAHTHVVDAGIIKSELPELEANEGCIVEFQIEASFVTFAGQVAD